MEWPKLKNIILIILLITNVFLLGLVGLREWNASRYRAQARIDALQVVRRSGITMEESALPEDLTLPAATVTRDRAKEGEWMARLLGEERPVTAQGGSEPMYAGERGSATVSSRGEIELTLSREAYPVSGELADHAVDLLEQINVRTMVLSSQGDREGGTVALMQLWNEVPVRTCRLTVTYGGETEPIVVSGTCFLETPAPVGEVELSAVTGLLRFLEKFSDTGDVCNEILGMQAGYQLTASLSEPSALTPVWYFVTDSGAYALDTLTNQLKKL